MLLLVNPSNYEFHRQDLDDMYRLRHKIFYEELKWDVKSVNGMERDEYDEKHAHYIIYKDEQGIVRGCIRLIEMTNPCMFDGPFKVLLPDLKDFKRPGYWEKSRLAVDRDFDKFYTHKDMNNVFISIMIGTIYFGLELENVESFLGLSFLNIAKLYCQYGFPGTLITERNLSGNQLLVASYTPLRCTYEKLLKKINIDSSQPLFITNNKPGCLFNKSYNKSRERRSLERVFS